MKRVLQSCSFPGNSGEVNRPSSAATLALLAFIFLGPLGCNVGPKYVRPIVPAPSGFKELGPQQAPDGTVWKPAQPQDGILRGKWWEIYQEPELNSLEEKLNIRTRTLAGHLKISWLREPRFSRHDPTIIQPSV